MSTLPAFGKFSARPLVAASICLYLLTTLAAAETANRMYDCYSICHRTGVYGKFAGCRCSMTLFTKRSGYQGLVAGVALCLKKNKCSAGPNQGPAKHLNQADHDATAGWGPGRPPGGLPLHKTINFTKIQLCVFLTDKI